MTGPDPWKTGAYPVDVLAGGPFAHDEPPPDPGPMPTPAEPNGAKPRTVRWTAASSIKPRPVVWLWEDRIPVGELTLTPGRGGLGKSTFHAHLIARLTRGQLAGVYYGTPRTCAIAANEDSWERTIVPRLIAAGADLDLVGRVDVTTTVDEAAGTTLSLPEDVAGLERMIRQRHVALLSVDPLMSMINAERNTHHDRETRGALEPLGRLADRAGCAVLGNAHFNKTGSSDALDRLIGSVAFGNVARAVLSFAADDDGTLVMSQAKNNLGRTDPAICSLRFQIESVIVDTDEGPSDVGRIVALGESARSVREILGERINGDDDDHTMRGEIAEWLAGWLRLQSGREAKPTDVMSAAKLEGYAWRSVGRARKKAKIVTCRRGFQGGSVWMFAEDQPSHSCHSRHLLGEGMNGTNGGTNGETP